MRTTRSPARCLRLAILNDSPHVLKLLCDWFRQHGHLRATRMVAEMPQAHVEVEQFINQHSPMWSFTTCRCRTAVAGICSRSFARCLRSNRSAFTTRNKRKLEQVAGRTSVVEIAGQPEDLRRRLKAVEGAETSASAE